MGSLLIASLALARMKVKNWGVGAAPVKRWWLCPLAQAVRQTRGAPSKLLGQTHQHFYVCGELLDKTGPVNLLLSWENGQWDSKDPRLCG